MLTCIHAHTQTSVCVSAVMVTLIPGVTPTEGHRLAVRKRQKSERGW